MNEDGDYNGGLGINVDDLGDDEFQLAVELCMTRALPPALSLGHGVEKLREAIENLKLDPPCSQSGVLRFQVNNAVYEKKNKDFDFCAISVTVAECCRWLCPLA